jgi:N-acetylneuraminic acid mutarotase
MKKIILCQLFFAMLTPVFSQVGIGTVTPNASSVLELSSTTKGMLIPRMTTDQRNAIVSPASGLMILNLDDKCIDIYDGSSWVKNCGMKITGTDTIENGGWDQKANFGGIARDGGVGFSIAPFSYVGTGVSNGTYKKDFWQYNPATNVWTQKADFGGTARSSAVGVAFNGYGYIGTGIDGSFKSDWWEYLPATNTWTQKTNFSGAGRENAVAFVFGTNIYVGTGGDASVFYNDFRVFNPSTNSWSTGVPFTFKASNLITFSAAGYSYVGVGYYYSSLWGYYLDNAVYKFDGSTWTPIAIFPGAERFEAIAFGINGKGYVGLGKPFTANYYTDLWEYDPSGNVWEQQSSCPVGRAYAATFSINNKGYVCTGYNGAELQDLYVFDPAPIGNKYEMPDMPYPTYSLSDGMWSKEGNNVYSESNKLIGIGFSEPKNKLDILGSANRTNTHPTGRPLYVTGLNTSNSSGVEFRKDDGAQGIGFGYNTIYAAGNNADQNLELDAKGPAGSLIFTTNYNERARITGTGNMGIGTNSPNASAALDVTSTTKGILIPRMTTAQRNAIVTPLTGLLVFDISTNSFWFRGTSSWVELIDQLDTEVFRNGPDKIYAGMTDSVGIGTMDPEYKLDVKTAINQFGLAHTSGSVKIATWVGDGGEIGTVSNHSFRLFANNGLNQFQLMPNGNIGIGMINPQNKLDIVSGAARTGSHATGRPLYITGSLSDASNGVEIRDADGTQGVGIGRNTVYAAGSWADQNLGLAGKGTQGNVLIIANGAERVRFTPAGQVGIGTMFPHAQLQLATSVANRKLILYEVADNPHQFHGFGIDGDGALRYQTANSLNDHVFYAATSSTNSLELMRIKGDGNLVLTGSIATEAFVAPTLLNSFTNYGNGYAAVGYYKDKMGRVYLRGMVNNVSNPSGLVVFTLPTGYRPTSGKLVFTTTSNASMGRIDIAANGDVIINLGLAGWTSLDGISFKAD